MEENKEMLELLRQMAQTSRKQARWAKLQCAFSALALVCCLAAAALVLTVLPQVELLVSRADAVLQDASLVSQQLALADWSGVMEDLETVTQQMAQADLAGISQEVSALVTTSQTGLEETFAKLSAIDLETLNKAISDLSAVVEPLAKFVNRF